MSTIHQIGPRPTDLLHAELALGELWTQAGCELHFATSNLLVVTEEHHLQRVRTVLNDLGADSSGRQVILVLDAPTLPVQAALVWVRQSYVERIEAPVTLECLGQVMSELLRPATLNHTWWACGHPPVPAVLDTLARASDQLVLDTAGLHELGQVPCLLSDLAWARTARWRELIAQLFDDPLAVAQLGDLGDASVDFCGTDARPARLFAAWLADRLGWPDLQRIHLSWKDAHRERGDLTAVELSGPATRFSVRASGPLAHGEVVYGGHMRSFEVPLLPMTLAQGLSELMGSPVRDEHFVRALALLHRAPQPITRPIPDAFTPPAPQVHGPQIR